MRGSSAVIAALVAACYVPEPRPGAPCATSADCPKPLVCSLRLLCERDLGDAAPDGGPPGGDASGGDAPQSDRCTPGGEPACAANDRADGAIDVTMGGMFEGDAGLATDDVGANGCGGDGGRDLFFRVQLTAPQVYYFDTFGSSYDTVIRVYRKSCAAVGAGADAAACVDDACGGGQSQIAASLPIGESCVVVDGRDGAQASGALRLRVVRGGRDGLPLARGAQTYTGDTCNGTKESEPLDQNCDAPGTGGREHAYFFTTCPGETLRLDADTCPEPMWDPVLYVKRLNGNQLGCNDDSCGLGARIANVTISNSELYFLYLDGFSPDDCGPYQLDTNLRP